MNISELLKRGEGKTLEFKRDLSSPQNLLKTLVAFANTAGGKVIIGVEDKTRQPVGIENPGILLPGLTVEDMLQGVSRIRNPVIARAFRELNLIEQWGSGIPRIFRETADLGFPEPSIVELGLRLRFVVPLAESIQIRQATKQVTGAQSGARSTSILMALSDTPLPASEIATVLGLESKTGAFKRTIKELVEQGLIAYTIPEKPSSRLQKYRLTKKGSQVLQELPEKRKGQ